MRALTCSLVVASALSTGWSAPPPQRDEGDRRIDALVADADLLPAELSAEALLRIAASSSGLDAARRRQMLTDAFVRGYAAQLPYRRLAPGVPPHSRQAAQARASESGLTALSLQLRAVQLLIPADKIRARELFEWINPAVATASCDEALVPDISDYFVTLGVLARQTYEPGRRADALRFLEHYLWRARLPADLAAAAVALERFRPRSDEAAYLQSLFRTLLEAGDSDPRGFSAVGVDFIGNALRLDDSHKRLGLTFPYLLGAVRGYLQAQFTGPRCADSQTEPLVASTFNARVQRQRADLDGIDTLGPAETTPSGRLPASRIDLLWQTPASRRLYDQYVVLRGSGRDPAPLRVRLRKEWRERADQLVLDLEEWTGRSEAQEGDYFFQKAILLSELLDLTPASPERPHVIRAYVQFLRTAREAQTARALWFVFASRLLEASRGEDRAAILGLAESAGDPALALFARIERLRIGSRAASE